ncbi:MAG: hypothetical protein N2255_05115 [Kiritimatiellae bacterium]|nr:hypothetical protein [Kiritimatiellia bacterium]
MDKVIGKLCDLLKSDDNLKRCAGAIVLAELAPKDRVVVNALGAALKDAGQMLVIRILEAFEAIASPDVVPHVIPLLDAEDVEIKLRAVTVLSKLGSRIVPEVQSRLRHAGTAQKLVLGELLARIHTVESFRLILELLHDSEFEVVRSVCEAVRRHIVSAGSKERIALHKEAVSFMKSTGSAPNERVLASCLLLIGYLSAPQAYQILLRFAGPGYSGYLRRHALLGLRHLDADGKTAPAIAWRLLSFLEDSDDEIVRLSLDVLDRLPRSILSGARLRQLLESRHASVKLFATRKLVEEDTSAANRELLCLLRNNDGEIRDTAARALAQHKGAAEPLVEALLKETDSELAWTLAKILKPHASLIPAGCRKKLANLLKKKLLAGDALSEPLLYALRHAESSSAETVLREVGLAHKQAGRWHEAVECFRRLVGTESFSDDIRYELSICNLKLSPKELAPQVRGEDQALRGLQVLLHTRSFPLLERLTKDRLLDPAELYYVGFHFAEGVGQDKEFGQKVLEYVVKRWPKSREGKAAKNKLKIVKPGERPVGADGEN